MDTVFMHPTYSYSDLIINSIVLSSAAKSFVCARGKKQKVAEDFVHFLLDMICSSKIRYLTSGRTQLKRCQYTPISIESKYYKLSA